MGYIQDQWNAMLEGRFLLDQAPSSTGDGTWNDPVEVGGQFLGANELRKLLESFMRQHGYLPRTREEFEYWLAH